jgi:alkanesulfonate monooxygenase SsuD/methylene tetrahydromethanopterin reductase-like flavin-dependent oxidoreductase (luciferase family)
VISGGRLVLGLGAGWQRSEHEAYGIELPEVPERLARLEEACLVVRLLLTEERADFDGRYYVLRDAPCEPKGVQSRMPLLLGLSGERIGLSIAARHADIWNAWGSPELIAHKSEVLARHCEAAGRDPATIEHSAQVVLLMSDDRDQLARWAAEPPGMPHFSGSPGQVAELFARYRDGGLDEFVVSDRWLGGSASERRECMERLLEVASPFR